MKNTLVLLLITLFGFNLQSAAQDPVKWDFSSKKIDAKTFEIRLTATLEEDWHTYSQTTPDGGPLPTRIDFVNNPLIILNGSAKEMGKLEEHFEPLFGVSVKQYSSKITFVQQVKLKAAVKTVVNGTVTFMVCNDQECMPPKKQAFSIKLI